MFRHKGMKLQSPKRGKILSAHYPYYLITGHILRIAGYVVLW